jgi:hypothetical protein
VHLKPPDVGPPTEQLSVVRRTEPDSGTGRKRLAVLRSRSKHRSETQATRFTPPSPPSPDMREGGYKGREGRQGSSPRQSRTLTYYFLPPGFACSEVLTEPPAILSQLPLGRKIHASLSLSFLAVPAQEL